MSKPFKQVLIDIVGKELESKGFELASTKCYHGYPIYHRKSDYYIEIIQFGKNLHEPSLIVSCSIVYLDVSKEKSNIHYPTFCEFSNGDLNKICVDDCKDKFFLKGQLGKTFYFGDLYLVFGRGIVAVSMESKKPKGIKIKSCNPKTYNKVAKLIAKRLKSAYTWLVNKKIKKPELPYKRIVEIMNGKQLNYGGNKYVHTVLYSKIGDIRYVIFYDENKKIYTYSLEFLHVYDQEEWGFVCHKRDALPGYWSPNMDDRFSFFGTLNELMKEIEFEPTYKKYFV